MEFIDVQGALGLGADAVLVAVDVSAAGDLVRLARVTDDGRRFGVPVVADMLQHDLPSALGTASEYGADVIVTRSGATPPICGGQSFRCNPGAGRPRAGLVGRLSFTERVPLPGIGGPGHCSGSRPRKSGHRRAPTCASGRYGGRSPAGGRPRVPRRRGHRVETPGNKRRPTGMRKIILAFLLFTFSAFATNVKLYLKDGSYHICREYKT